MKNIYQSRSLYRYLITELKIMYMRAEHNEDEKNAKKYEEAFRKLEIIQEKSHLTPIGEKGKDREAYNRTLGMIEEKYSNKTKEELENVIEEIEKISEEFGIEIKKDKNELKEREQEEK